MTRSLNLRRGFTRLFWVLTVAWAVFCTVLVPMYLLWDRQNLAYSQHWKEHARCETDEAKHPQDVLPCLEFEDRNYELLEKKLSLKNFWIWDVALWDFELAAIVTVPAAIYGLALLVTWICRGFHTSKTAGTSSSVGSRQWHMPVDRS